MNKFFFVLCLLLFICIQSCGTAIIANQKNNEEHGYYYALYSDEDIKINAEVKEKIWEKVAWYPINQCYVGTPSPDFAGRFKVVWRDDKIFLLVEISDKLLMNWLEDGFENYWQGDCVEIFIDESHKGGDHHQNNNAFAYHVMHTGEVIDIDSDGQPKIFPDSVNYVISKNGDKYVWKMAVTVYSNKYDPKSESNESNKIKLFAGKKMGFTVAYGDNNGEGRECFYGSTPGQGDTGYMNSDKFGTLELIKR
ncbi:MAG: CBM9 family sugar-binding protein [Endomicrobia bacterium]|nr:CBM9 family sugar-binding protein [Endomicrobiia bacterium]